MLGGSELSKVDGVGVGEGLVEGEAEELCVLELLLGVASVVWLLPLSEVSVGKTVPVVACRGRRPRPPLDVGRAKRTMATHARE
jgi:hypothetical protein